MPRRDRAPGFISLPTADTRTGWRYIGGLQILKTAILVTALINANIL